MATEFTLPTLGENIDKADVSRILVKEGDTIEAEQVVLELETDKAVLELPCPYAGKIVKIFAKEGGSLAIGAPVLSVESTGALAVPTTPKSESPKSTTAPVVAKPPQSTAPAASKPAATPTVQANGHAPSLAASSIVPERNSSEPIPAGPFTRRLARELGVQLGRVNGSGPGGRITPEDVQAFVRGVLAGGSAGGGSIPVQALPDFSSFGNIERKSLNKIAKVSAANLSYAWQTIPHVTQHELVDITALEDRRKNSMKTRGEHAPKITMTVLAMKAAVACLKAFPQFNASFDSQTGEVVHKQYYNIGVAVDTEHGLVVPVVKNVDQKSILDLSTELGELAVKARARKLDVADFKGGTFTISNLGGIGGTGFTPIVNWPEVAILGISKSRIEPVFVDGKVEGRLLMPLSLSYDHRVINGADAARFCVKLAAVLTDPFELLVET